MKANPPPPNPIAIAKRFWRVVKLVGHSEVRGKIITLAVLLFVLAFGLNQLNVQGNHVNKAFIDALEVRNQTEFWAQARWYVGIFAVSTIVAVMYRFTEERLGIIWRGWLTDHLIRTYMSARAYLQVAGHPEIDNPDQRITEDVKNFTTVTLSFTIILLNAALSFVSFSLVLWGKSSLLWFAAIIYAIVGTLGTAFLARRLVGLNSNQFAREADLRYELICIREYADQMAVQQDENRESPRLRQRLHAVINNLVSIVSVNRNVGFFTIFYDYMKPVAPVLIVAPLYVSGTMKTFGDVTQAAAAFTTVVASISVFVTEFRRISEFAAVVARVCSLWDVIEAAPEPRAIVVTEDPTRLAVEHLSLVTPREALPLITDLTFDLRPGQRLLVAGPTGSGKSELMRAIAGLTTPGSGKVFRPRLGDIAFVPQVPYLATVPLRDLVRSDLTATAPDDGPVREALTAVGFDAVMTRVGGLDAVHDWSSKLALGEQHLLALARLLVAKPKFAVLDATFSGIEPQRISILFARLNEAGITFITLDQKHDLAGYHDLVLHLDGKGGWRFGETRESPEKYFG